MEGIAGQLGDILMLIENGHSFLIGICKKNGGIKIAGPRKRAQGRAQDIPYHHDIYIYAYAAYIYIFFLYSVFMRVCI